MRDPGGIDLVLDAIRGVRSGHPDPRLGRLLVNAVRPSDPCPEVYDIEDDRLLHQLDDLERPLKSTGEND
jgi:hypothetical protein